MSAVLERASPVAAPDVTPCTRMLDSLRHIPRASWDACFPDAAEGYDYLLAAEDAALPGFRFRYVTVCAGDRVLLAAPMFFSDYGLETTLEEGRLRRAITAVRRYVPRFLMMRLACLGSPVTECAPIGFHPEVPEHERPALFTRLLHDFERTAREAGATLLAVRDLTETQNFLHPCLARYGRMPGLPGACLDIDFADIDAYLARLSKETRKDMRRKLKSRSEIRIERRTNIDDVLPQVLELYRETKARSTLQFEDLTAAYFSGVLAGMPTRALCTLYYAGDRLLAANLLLHDRDTLIDKFFCMSEAGRAHNLYFVSWFYNLELCLEYGLRRYRSGQAAYAGKLRLKSRLEANDMYFRHVRPWVNALLLRIAPLFALGDPT